MYNVILYWIYAILISIITIIPGYYFTTFIRNLSSIEKLLLSFVFSILILLLLMPFFIFGLGLVAIILLIFLFSISLYSLKTKLKKLKLSHDLRFLIIVLILAFVLRLFIQTLWQYPTPGGDWAAHTFTIPYNFDTGNWAPPLDRPPLFNILIYNYHQILGSSLYSFWISQIISCLLGTILIIPAFLIAKHVFDNKVAKISSLFMIINPFLIENSILTWPKLLAGFFILGMIYFLFIRKNNYILAGFFAGLAYLTHNYTCIFILTAIIILIYKRNTRNLFFYIFTLLIILLPYFLWTYSYYGTLFTSRFIYYPLAVDGYDDVFNKNPEEILTKFKNTPMEGIIAIRAENAILTVTPILPLAIEMLPVSQLSKQWPFLFYYYHTYPGALTFIMYLLVALWFIWFIKKKIKKDKLLFMFIWIPLLFSLLLWGWNEYGLVRQTLHPTIPILIMFAFYVLYQIKNKKFAERLKYFIFIAAIIEGIYFGSMIHATAIEANVSDISWIKEFVPDFNPSLFVSAYYLIGGFDIFNFLIFLIIIFILFISYAKNVELYLNQFLRKIKFS